VRSAQRAVKEWGLEGIRHKFVFCGEGEAADYRITKIRKGKEAGETHFAITAKEGMETELTTSLLGRHNLVNTTLAFAAAHSIFKMKNYSRKALCQCSVCSAQCAVEDVQFIEGSEACGRKHGEEEVFSFPDSLLTNELVKRVEEIKQIPHRLQYIEGAGGLNIIDDSYNANPEGVKAALEVLMGFCGKKYVITCGIVEQGRAQGEVNRELGRQIANKNVDAVALVGLNAPSIKEGLLSAGFSEANIFCADSSSCAVALFKDRFGFGDTLLFMNDLPDNF
jgi:UDP-N-acetylmuramyl pentapeptide synthase